MINRSYRGCPRNGHNSKKLKINMKLNESLLSPKELELLKTAEEILCHKQKPWEEKMMMLSGSLALAIQGINKPREADDIDICNYGCNEWDISQTGASQVTGASEDYDEFFCEFSMNGHKIHYLEMSLGEPDNEYVSITHGDLRYRVLKAKYILEYKMRHAFDNDHGNPQKHKNDLIYILSNN